MKINERRFKLGMYVGEIKAWCEAAKNDAKKMSFSAPFNPNEYAFLLTYMEDMAKKNNVNFYLEKDLLDTDLFPDIDLKGMWVFIIYKRKDIIKNYFSLKEEKNRLENSNKYNTKNRINLGRKLGNLLGYSDEVLNDKFLS
jgi:hypothetical protein